MIIHWDACIDTASPSATPLATWLLVFDTATTTSPPLSRSLPLCQPKEFDLDLVLYLSPIPVVHSEVRFPFKRVHQLLTNSLFQSTAQNLLVADEAIDVFTKADAEGEMKKIDKMKKAVAANFIVLSRLLFAVFWTWKLSQMMTHSQMEKEMGRMVHHILLFFIF